MCIDLFSKKTFHKEEFFYTGNHNKICLIWLVINIFSFYNAYSKTICLHGSDILRFSFHLRIPI